MIIFLYIPSNTAAHLQDVHHTIRIKRATVWLYMCPCEAGIDWTFASSLSISIHTAMRLKKTPAGTAKDWPIDWGIDRWVRDTSSCVHSTPNLIFCSFTHLSISLTPSGNSSPKKWNEIVIIYSISHCSKCVWHCSIDYILSGGIYWTIYLLFSVQEMWTMILKG